MEPENPFIDFNADKQDDSAVIPSFPREKQLSLRISEEAWERLKYLIVRYTTHKPDQTGLAILLEHIGLYALDIERPQNIIDPETNITTEQCRESGFLDAMQGDAKIFLTLYGENLTDKHQAAYMRGFLEGNYIKTRG